MTVTESVDTNKPRIYKVYYSHDKFNTKVTVTVKSKRTTPSSSAIKPPTISHPVVKYQAVIVSITKT